MKVEKYFCDRCKKEIEGDGYFIGLDENGVSIYFEQECYELYEQFLYSAAGCSHPACREVKQLEDLYHA